jgi:hypothetical protein
MALLPLIEPFLEDQIGVVEDSMIPIVVVVRIENERKLTI